ncbi:hypothetical protein [Nocardia grenadensis]|uniref:hypothetical protein n=1 Tax=Nocardia grenadensis TaxID=931537 RepID=UPI003D943E20
MIGPRGRVDGRARRAAHRFRYTLLIGTGRRAATADEQDALGESATRLPLVLG